MLDKWARCLDWFLPASIRLEKSDLGFYRSFVFLHLVGPLLGQSIAVFLFMAEKELGWEFWTIELTICLFWLFPFALKYWGSLVHAAFVSVQLLIFVSLFGSFHYGGMSSPFQPWLLVAILLGFFYLSDRPRWVMTGLSAQIAVFTACYAIRGSFPSRIPVDDLADVNLISVSSATIYMSLMAIYYATVMLERSELEREAERHRETATRLKDALKVAKDANRDKSIFLAKMSHELRTPLNAVIGYSEMLVEDASEQGNEERLSDLQKITEAGRHLLSLVTDVLDLTRIEADMIDLQVTQFSLDDFLAGLISTASPMITKQNNRFRLVASPPLGDITTDPLKLRQSLLNLLSNAGKFTSDGMVTLTVRRIHNAVGGSVLFEVTDTGIGIAQQDLAKLFKSFGQATSETFRKYGGTGLGLVLTKRFCTLMGGTVEVSSELGRGSTFTIALPADFAAADRSAASDPPLRRAAA